MDNTLDVISEMVKIDPEFGATYFFNRELIRKACSSLGIPDSSMQNLIISRSRKISHGKYKFTPETSAEPHQPPVIVPLVVPIESKTTIDNVGSVSLACVPRLESGYVPFGTYKNVEKILVSRKFFPVYITGPSGNGKSSMVLNICAKNKIPLIRINCSVQSDEEKLVGSKTLVDGTIKIVDGPLVTAMRQGAAVCLEEIDALDTRLALVLQGICEGRSFYFALTGETIVPAPGFNIIGIGNTKGVGSEDGRYIGVNIQNSAFLERFGCTFEQSFPSQSEELKMVLNWMKMAGNTDKNLASALVKWAATVRSTHAAGGIDEIISTRRLNHIVVAHSIYDDILLAIKLCTARFDESVSSAMRELFSKIYIEVEVKVVNTELESEDDSKETSQSVKHVSSVFC